MESPAWGIQPATGEVSTPLTERRLCRFRTRLGAGCAITRTLRVLVGSQNSKSSCGTVKGAPVPWRVIALRFPRNALSPRVNATGDVRRRVNICLKLRDVAVVVCTLKLRLRPTPSDSAARVARFRCVRRVHEPNRDTGVERLVLDTSRETGKGPVVKTAIHPLLVVEMFADVREVFEHDNWRVELLGVLNGFSGRLFHDVGECVLVVTEAFVHSPLLGVTLLQALQRRVHFLAEMASTSAVVDVRLGWNTVPTGTARQEFGFTDVEPDRRWVVRLFWFRDRVLDADVKHPVGSVLLQSELADRHVAVEQVLPQLALFGIDTEWDPESVPTSGLWDAPAKLVFAFFRVVERPSTIREPDGVVVSNLAGIVRPAELRDVVLERVLRVGREIVAGDDIVDRRLRSRTAPERFRKGVSVGRHGTLKPLLFVRRWWCERGFERFRGDSFGGHPTVQSTTAMDKNITDLSTIADGENDPIHSQRRTTRMAHRTQKRTRVQPERVDAGRREVLGFQSATERTLTNGAYALLHGLKAVVSALRFV